MTNIICNLTFPFVCCLIAGGSGDEVKLRQLHVTCNVHPPVQCNNDNDDDDGDDDDDDGDGDNDDDDDDDGGDDGDDDYYNIRLIKYTLVRHFPIKVATSQKSDQG